MNLKNFLATLISAISCNALATPFDNCPSDGFLVQDQIARLYGVNLAGAYQRELAPAGWTSSKLNALAFNSYDNYLYAYSYGHDALVRFGRDYAPELVGEPIGLGGFYVGDIATNDNAMFLYKRGKGIYRVSLDDSSPDFSLPTLIDGSESFSMAIYDLAFHPFDGFAYAIDRAGDLWKIGFSPASSEVIANVGQSGTFGAAYFDVTGKLYVSRNNDGHVYRVDVSDSNPIAELFFIGPASSNNDGARCAFAPIIPEAEPTIDFGSAPESYGTSLSANGARHGNQDSSIYLGSGVDYENDAFLVTGTPINDNDGVQWLTDLPAGQTALAEITASATGYASMWVDFNLNGEFDSNEQVLADKALDAGRQVVAIPVPASASEGETWMRTRFSSAKNLGPMGGAPDGEVEDYEVTLTHNPSTTVYYPRQDGFATLAFEDNWPLQGDYDMNDLVIQYRLNKVIRGGSLVSVTLEGRVVAMGASYHNGFALRLSGLKRYQIDEAGISYRINGISPGFSPLETQREDAIIIVAEDLHDYSTPGESCKYFRTESGCGSSIQMEFEITVPVVANVPAAVLGDFPLDPFLFATPGFERNYVFGEAPGRRFEIHLKDQAPTEAFQNNFFGRGIDDSNPTKARYFVNQNGMPWALNIPTEWDHPLEYMDIKWAYPEFHDHVKMSGKAHQDWYLKSKAKSKNIFRK